jgi:hypothetical protein
VGTSNGSDAATNLLDVAGATLRTTFLTRSDLRVPRLFFDLRFVAAKVARKLRRIARRKARRNRESRRRIVGQAHRLPPWATEAVVLQQLRDHHARPM